MKKTTPVRPGLVLKKLYLENNNMSVEELADRIDINKQDIIKIIKGKISISPEIALKLCNVFGTQPEFWINL